MLFGIGLFASSLRAADPPPADPPDGSKTPASVQPASPPVLLSPRKTDLYTGGRILVRPATWNAADPAAGELSIQLSGDDGSRIRALFQPISRPLGPDEKIDPDGPTLASWLLRPGNYMLSAAAGTLNSQTKFELHSSIRRSSFQVIDAGFDLSSDLAPRGQDGLGFNVLFPFADRPGVSAAWTAATEPLIVGTPPGDAALPGLWLPTITDPLRRAKDVADGSSEGSPAGCFAPAFQFEWSRARNSERPAMCLPSASPRDPGAWQLERNLAFLAGLPAAAAGPLSGAAPAGEPAVSPRLLETVTAANKLAARLGTIFTTMPRTRSAVALLVPSPSADNAKDQRRALVGWIAGQTAHHRMDLVTPTDVIDGVVSRHYRAVVVVAGMIDGRTAGVLTRYVQAGGVVLLADDAVAEIPGALKLGIAIDLSHFAAIDKLVADGKPLDAARLRRPLQLMRAADPPAKALRTRLEAVSIRPVMECDSPTVVIARHAYGDIEYFFVVNATPDDAAGSDPLAVKATSATLALPLTGGPVYDAISGQPATAFKSDGVKLAANIRLGAGQMRVFARTARPIGGVQVSSPQVVSDYDSPLPIRLELSAAAVDADGRTLNGAIPLRVRVTDALGVVRYDLWRSTERGVLRMELPLAANDPAGRWTVSVQELLSMTSGQSPFEYRPPAQIGVIAELSTGFDAAGDRPRRERPMSTSVTAASKATRPGEATTLWRTSMPDRVVSLQVVQQKLTVFSHDGTATQIDAGGKVLAQEAAPVIASPRPPEPLPKAVASNVLKGQGVKRSATEAGLTAVCYWGGMVQIFGPDGTARTEQVMPSGVADLLWLDGKLIVGLSDGEVVAIKAGD